MASHVNEVSILKKIKSNLDQAYYKKGEELERDFFQSISLVWDRIDDWFEDDLSQAYQVNKYLVDQVVEIHRNEDSESNRLILREGANIRKAGPRLEDGKKAYKIYSLNEEEWDYYLIGDLHSDSLSLRKILSKTDFFNKLVAGGKTRLVFLGDYVDRGKKHLETLQIILSLKFLFPNNIFLLQGNHDGGSFKDGRFRSWVRIPDGADRNDWFFEYLYNLVEANDSLDQAFIDIYINFFNSLANIGFIASGETMIMLSHGGIPRYRTDNDSYYSYLRSISDLTDERIVDRINRTIISNIVWSDPGLEGEDLREDLARFRYLEEHFLAFKELIGFDIFIRGHQAEPKGYRKFFNDRLITIFSTGSLMVDGININGETAYEKVSPKIINLNQGQVFLIDLGEK